MKIVSWVLRVIVAVILLQTLFFKFTGAEESVWIFSTLGAEPWGRYGSGVIELVTSILLFIPGSVAIGAALGLATAAGAILSHLAFLGVDVRGDGGLLFALAIVVFAGSAALLVIHRGELPVVGRALGRAPR